MFSNKLWIVRISMVLSIFLLFIASSHVLYMSRTEFIRMFSMPWGLFWLSVLLQVIPGMLLVISPEVFLNLKKVKFDPAKFIVLAIIPIVVLIYFVGFWSRYWSIPLEYVPDFMMRTLTYYFYTNFGLTTSSIWLGVAIGKAIHIRQ